MTHAGQLRGPLTGGVLALGHGRSFRLVLVETVSGMQEARSGLVDELKMRKKRQSGD
jgi:hypothetical protein